MILFVELLKTIQLYEDTQNCNYSDDNDLDYIPDELIRQFNNLDEFTKIISSIENKKEVKENNYVMMLSKNVIEQKLNSLFEIINDPIYGFPDLLKLGDNKINDANINDATFNDDINDRNINDIICNENINDANINDINNNENINVIICNNPSCECSCNYSCNIDNSNLFNGNYFDNYITNESTNKHINDQSLPVLYNRKPNNAFQQKSPYIYYDSITSPSFDEYTHAIILIYQNITEMVNDPHYDDIKTNLTLNYIVNKYNNIDYKISKSQWNLMIKEATNIDNYLKHISREEDRLLDIQLISM